MSVYDYPALHEFRIMKKLFSSPRVTLRDIAKTINVSHVTVSLASRNASPISTALRRRNNFGIPSTFHEVLITRKWGDARTCLLAQRGRVEQAESTVHCPQNHLLLPWQPYSLMRANL